MKKRFVLWGALIVSAAYVLVGAPAAHATGDHSGGAKVEFCHATASETNPYNLIETSVNAFYNAGHHTHQNGEDIVPPFEGFAGLNWDAEGQEIFNNGCVVPVTPPEEPEPVIVTPLSPTFEDACELAVTVNIPDDTDKYTFTALVNADGYAKVTATALTGFIFDNGYTTRVWEHQSTNDEPCEPVEPPTEEPPVVTPPVEPPVVPQPPVDKPVVPVDTKLVTLPETGAGDVWLGVLAGLAASGLIAGGALLLLLDRKRKTEGTSSNS